eukprot:GFKZ01013843.1.p1 GENE.GFKZ01013843.1~~GFKZ01013843.1.p1  ORF type:complete len:299 (-),score=26.37 GFKZ01013843.1:730-1626(-)
MPTAPPHPPVSSLLSTVASDPLAAEFLLSLFTTAAFSQRFSTLLPSLPPEYIHPSTHQPQIDLLRSDLLSLPPLPTLTPPLPPRLYTLLSHLLYHPNSTIPYLKSTTLIPSTSSFPPSECSSTRSVHRFLLSNPTPAQTPPAEKIIAFHGSPPENWHSILLTGLKVPPSDTGVANGRMFGDAAYLSTHIELALSFAPHLPMQRIRASRIASASIVGEFDVDATRAEARSHGAEDYVVVQEVRHLNMRAMSVLLQVKGRCTEIGGWLGWVARARRRLGASALWLVVVAYLVGLVLVGRR